MNEINRETKERINKLRRNSLILTTYTTKAIQNKPRDRVNEIGVRDNSTPWKQKLEELILFNLRKWENETGLLYVNASEGFKGRKDHKSL